MSAEDEELEVKPTEDIDPDSDEAIERAATKPEEDEQANERSADTEVGDEAALAELAGETSDMVPRSRLNEVLERERAREKEIADFLLAQKSLQQPAAKEPDKPFDIKAAVRQRNKLLVEGNEDEAFELDQKIEDARQEIAIARAVEIVEQKSAARTAAKAAKDVIGMYPQLNDDPDLVEEVVSLRDGYIARGVPIEEAIAKAAKRLLGEPPTKEAIAASAKASEDEVAARRLKAQIRNAGVKQPAATSDAGKSSASLGLGSKIDPRSISDADFNKMSAAQLDELERSLASQRKTV